MKRASGNYTFVRRVIEMKRTSASYSFADSKKLQADSAARVIKCVFEIRHFKQRIPGLVGVTCG